ncbi:MAG: glutamate-semialdehyde -aminomutase [Actinomycetota bacterium]|jgi:glutamate-1-semialdehyde 2,1-aminomutase|nr:glutamate-semialdehyde -aminomutase [Actinomycetota bacterium]
MEHQASIDRERLRLALTQEDARFEADHPRSLEMFERARSSLLAGVPMPWMTQWAGRFPIFVEAAGGARFTDVDGNSYVDFCLGDTGAMTGHSPASVADAISEQAHRGITTMLPTTDALAVSQDLAERFGLPYWQFCLTATDANRFTIRIARELTGRPKILVFSWCYHGTVDETFIVLENGKPKARPGAIGPPVDPTVTTRVVEWNDTEALERELAHGDVACVLTEPVLTNIGIIHPEPGFHDSLRELTSASGTYLVIDETHTLCAGPGGYTGTANLQPDFITLGKPIASGLPAAAYGMSAEVGEVAIVSPKIVETSDIGGIGGTLSGNALSLAAMRATLDGVLTPEAFEVMIPLAERFETGVQEAIDRHGLPWHVSRLGCRVEYAFRTPAPRNGSEAAAAVDHDLDRYLHLFMLNRGVLMTPFHNMALMSPATTESDVDLHAQLFDQAVAGLIA